MPNLNFSDFLYDKFPLSAPKKYFNKRWISLAAIQLFSCSLLMAIPEVATAQANRKSFRICSKDLLSLGLSESEVANACGAALKPRDLSRCVTKIYDNTTDELPAEDILFNCQRVRRVDELGTCVKKINKAFKNKSNESAVLENCRLSLLPESFSSCVIGLSDNVGLSTEELLATCLNQS
ncbi:MAG: hypothetical protein F6K40_31180 [Okeania sp. SIO3I5]|uniref:hypothetical protein n=1 Tax=Okeania sp. SIO3I5 TaxID=2607805 RepID=UPI0013B76644|nr:hypothetical protein [Okeania sp. SIO3I5]NEQ40454.1 hypothetical protein [Okeania sp. SIO3I5]